MKFASLKTSKLNPGGVFFGELRARNSYDPSNTWLEIYHLLFHTTRRDDKASVMYALDAATEIAARPISPLNEATVDVMVPRWVINAIGTGWNSFYESANPRQERLAIAFGMESRKGQRAIKTRHKLEIRNLLICLDVETLILTKQKKNKAQAGVHLFIRYRNIKAGSIAKACRRFQPHAHKLVVRMLGVIHRANP